MTKVPGTLKAPAPVYRKPRQHTPYERAMGQLRRSARYHAEALTRWEHANYQRDKWMAVCVDLGISVRAIATCADVSYETVRRRVAAFNRLQPATEERSDNGDGEGAL